MENAIERRSSRRFTMALPVTVRSEKFAGQTERNGQTRDVSFRGLYFTTDAAYEAGTHIEFVLTLPREITQMSDVSIRCYGKVVRVEKKAAQVTDGNCGIAARIDRYEFLPAPA